LDALAKTPGTQRIIGFIQQGDDYTSDSILHQVLIDFSLRAWRLCKNPLLVCVTHKFSSTVQKSMIEKQPFQQ
jgi:hypothetical protein